jgi:hypothetical protein
MLLLPEGLQLLHQTRQQLLQCRVLLRDVTILLPLVLQLSLCSSQLLLCCRSCCCRGCGLLLCITQL